MHQRSLFTLFAPLFAPKTSLLNKSHKTRLLKPFKPSLISLRDLNGSAPSLGGRPPCAFACPPFTLYVKCHVLAHNHSSSANPSAHSSSANPSAAPWGGNIRTLARLFCLHTTHLRPNISTQHVAFIIRVSIRERREHPVNITKLILDGLKFYHFLCWAKHEPLAPQLHKKVIAL